MTKLSISVADILLSFSTKVAELDFLHEIGLKKYIISTSLEDNFQFNYTLEKNIFLDEYKLVFVANLENSNEGLDYKWNVYQHKTEVVIEVIYENHSLIKQIVAFLNPVTKNIFIKVVPVNFNGSNFALDPLIHPLGSLLLLYIMHWSDSILLHGSSVKFKEKTFLFTGVSGIGKSTMARLWKECGADVINDDRLILKRIGKNVKVYNNPMPYYQQEPKEGVLNGIFLLKQDKCNYIKKVEGVQAFTRVLANCIQQFYEPALIKKHLALVEEIVQSVPVYEIGFLPTHDIVKDILKFTEDENKG